MTRARASWVIFSACTLLLLAACAPKTAGRVKLPGFSLEPPAGKVSETSQVPTGGKHKIELSPDWIGVALSREVASPQFIIEWQAQGSTQAIWKRDYLPIIVHALDSAIKGATLLREQTVDPHRWIYVMGKPKLAIAVGVVDCNRQFEVTVTYARFTDIDRQVEAVRTILESVRCELTPANITRPVAAFRLPEKFGRTASNDPVTFRSLDNEIVVLNFTSGDVRQDHEVLRTVVSALLTASMKMKVEEQDLEFVEGIPPTRAAALVRARISADDHMFIGAVSCPELSQSLMMIFYAPQAKDALAIERLSQIGCPGETSTAVGDFPAMVNEACSAGDANACAIQKEPD